MTERRGIVAASTGLVLLAAVAAPAWSYRPYDSTDAGVAAAGELEAESGYSPCEMADEQEQGLHLVVNYGVGNGREVVLEGAEVKIAAPGRPSGSTFFELLPSPVRNSRFLPARTVAS